ncbi:MAG TPA: hypothetical protein DEA08_01040 [Planctomycetes bacterium]|nr:hypothetical protein [Planctomycetota bacterium]
MNRGSVLLTLLLLAAGPLAWAQPTEDDQLPFKEENGTKTPLFMHGKTFGANTSGWARDDVEVEAAMTVIGIEGKRLAELVNERDLRAFRRLRRSSTSEAFSLGFDFDEIPWGGDEHDVREGRLPDGPQRVQPYVWLTIERDKFPIDEERGRRRLDLGTDTMDDIYYDTDEFLLLRNSMSIRARKRWDTTTEMRRLLIALKLERGVDDLGIKRAAKTDVREDGPSAEAITGLDEAVLRGVDSWRGTPAIPLRRAYMTLKHRGGLTSTPSYEDVLALQPKAFLRSVRSRYHLNEVSVSRLREVHTLGKTRLEAIATFARNARIANEIDQQHLAKVQAWEDKVRLLLDGTLVAERAAAELAKLGHPNASVASIQSLMPGSTTLGSGGDLEDIARRAGYLEQRKVVADTVSALYHEVSRELDDGTGSSLRRIITRSLDRKVEDHVEWFRDWRRSVKPENRKWRTPDPIMTDYRAMVADDAQLAAYNAFGEKQRADGERSFRRFRPLSSDDFDLLRYQIRNEQVRVWMRQIETAGSAARGLWFDEAREFYIPRSRRETGNFLIDTMDFASMYRGDVWGDVAPPERTAAVDLTKAPYSERLMDSRLVNEVQIELNSGGEYTKRIKEPNSLIGLPRAFMRWAQQEGLAATPAEYKALAAEIKALGDDELQARIAPLNQYLEDSGAPIQQISHDEFRDWLHDSRLTLAVRDDPDYSEPALEKAREGARFVVKTYVDMLKFIADLKRERVLEVLDDAGAPDGIQWVPASGSKGSIAIAKVKELEDAENASNPGHGEGPGGNLGGIIDFLDTNNTLANAAAVTRGTTHANEIKTDSENDFYRFTIKKGETVTFKIAFEHDKGDLDMELLDADGDTIETSQGTDDEETIRYTAQEDTTVSLKVYGYDEAKARYTLEVE